jgi:hypothetical protein
MPTTWNNVRNFGGREGRANRPLPRLQGLEGSNAVRGAVKVLTYSQGGGEFRTKSMSACGFPLVLSLNLNYTETKGMLVWF